MEEWIVYLLVAVISLGVGIVIGRVLLHRFFKQEEEKIKEKAQLMIKEAELTSENIKKDKMLEAKERFLKLRAEIEEESNKKKKLIITNENQLKQREQNLSTQMEMNKEKYDEIDAMRENLSYQINLTNKRREEIEKVHPHQVRAIA